MANRVRELRKARGWTVDQLAELTGLSKSQISRIETDQRGWSVDSLGLIADAFGVTVGELLDTTNAWQDVPIFGVIGDMGVLTPGDGGNTQAVRVPAAFGQVIALRVDSDSLYPRYIRGEHILCGPVVTDIGKAAGKECLVFLPDGRGLLRIILAGSTPRVWNLTSHSQPPMLDATVLSCRPVIRF